MTVDQVIKYFGGMTKAAEKLDTTRQTISRWNKRGYIPKLAQLLIENVTDGDLKADRKYATKAVKGIDFD